LEKFSVGICAHNEEENIRQLVINVLNQHLSEKFSLEEIIVVASGCTDSTPEIVRKLSREDKRVELIEEEERGGKATAVNKILHEYIGDALVLVAADAQPGNDSLNSLLDTLFSAEDIGVVGSHPIPVNPTAGLANSLTHFIWKLHHHTLNYLNSIGKLSHASGEMMALKRNVCTEIPPNVVNEDAFISIEAKKRGYHVFYDKNSTVFITGTSNVAEFVTQRVRVVVGHHQVKRILGVYPITLEGLFFSGKITTIFPVFKRAINECSASFLPKILITISAEAIVNTIAFFNHIRSRYPYVWRRTKT